MRCSRPGTPPWQTGIQRTFSLLSSSHLLLLFLWPRVQAVEESKEKSAATSAMPWTSPQILGISM